MHKTGHSKTGIPLQVAGRARPEKAAAEGRSLVLDDILATIDQARRMYHLSEARFGLGEIEQEPSAKAAAEKIIRSTLVRHGPEIHSKPHPLFAQVCDIRRGKPIDKPGFHSRYRVPPVHAHNVLRLVLERALQTIVQLPKRDPPSVAPPLRDGTRELKQLARHCEKLAKETDSVFRERAVSKRASAYFEAYPGSGLDQFFRQAEELQKTAETLRMILAKTHMVKQKTDSPNPQVRYALNLVGWSEAATGRKQYRPFKDLLNAAFAANAIDTPPWVERLEVEMNRHRTRRKAWVRSITVPSRGPISPQSLQIPS
jgi:hypothetical protein